MILVDNVLMWCIEISFALGQSKENVRYFDIVIYIHYFNTFKLCFGLLKRYLVLIKYKFYFVAKEWYSHEKALKLNKVENLEDRACIKK